MSGHGNKKAYVLLLVVLLEGSSEVGLHLEVPGNLGNGGVLELDEVKEPLPVGLYPQIVLLWMNY